MQVKMSTMLRFLMAIAVVGLIAPGAMALNVGGNYTIYDGLHSGGGWYGPQEDDEVEPPATSGDAWDLEGFYILTDFSDPNNPQSTMSMVGTYDFINGASGRNTYYSGDLFIDWDGNAVYGAAAVGYAGVPPYNGYDFVLDLSFDDNGNVTNLYDIVALTPGSVVSATTAFSPGSDPYRYVRGGTVLASGISMTYLTGQTVPGLNPPGPVHNVVQFDWDYILSVIDPLATRDSFTLHFTMGCGNDNLMGNLDRSQEPPVPEPASMALLGMGILGFVMRKRFTA